MAALRGRAQAGRCSIAIRTIATARSRCPHVRARQLDFTQLNVLIALTSRLWSARKALYAAHGPDHAPVLAQHDDVGADP